MELERAPCVGCALPALAGNIRAKCQAHRRCPEIFMCASRTRLRASVDPTENALVPSGSRDHPRHQAEDLNLCPSIAIEFVLVPAGPANDPDSWEGVDGEVIRPLER